MTEPQLSSRRRRVWRTTAAVATIGGLLGIGLMVLPSAGAEPRSQGDEGGAREGIPGQLYYPDASGQYHIVADGEPIDSPWAEDPAVSHDGKTAAWLESGGYLIVEDTAGTMHGQFPPTEGEEVVSGQCVWPTWSPTNDQLLYAVAVDGDESDLRIQVRDVPSGELRASFPAEGACNFTWAADGSGLFAQHGYDGDMVAMDVDGAGRREFSVPAEGAEVSLFSASAGGEEICVAQGFQHSDDELFATTCNATFDTATGEPTGTVSGGGGAQAVFYTADGYTLIRTSTESGMKVTLYDADREVLAEYGEPDEFADYPLAHYLP